ncbi:MAG: uracil-DNA glycosylase [Anaeromyxobacteraceae bacterium]
MIRDGELGELAEETRRHLLWLREAGFRDLPVPAAPVTTRPVSPPLARPPASLATPDVPVSPVTPIAGTISRGPDERGCGSEPLLSIRRDLGECTRCKLSGGRTHLVFGVGNPEAELMFVGEGPGADEDRQGEPFVGRAGQLLTKMIEAMGFRREDVYIANVVKCRPPDNRNPEPDELAACEPFLRAQIAAIRPRVLVALGKFAAQTLLRDPTPITRLRGGWREYEGVRLMPTFHPAYLLRSPAEKAKAWEDLKLVVRELGRTLPAR